MRHQLNVSSPVYDTSKEAIDALPFLMTALASDVEHRGWRKMDEAPELPTAQEFAVAEIRDGLRVLVMFGLFWCVGLDDDGEPLTRDGWVARVDGFFAEPVKA